MSAIRRSHANLPSLGYMGDGSVSWRREAGGRGLELVLRACMYDMHMFSTARQDVSPHDFGTFSKVKPHATEPPSASVIPQASPTPPFARPGEPLAVAVSRGRGWWSETRGPIPNSYELSPLAVPRASTRLWTVGCQKARDGAFDGRILVSGEHQGWGDRG